MEKMEGMSASEIPQRKAGVSLRRLRRGKVKGEKGRAAVGADKKS